MATNPNPTRISAEMWRFWEEFKKIEPSVRLGGIYANKPGYHNYRDALPSWDYSKQLDADKLGSGQYASAIDLTFPDAQAGDYKTIRKYSARLLNSGRDVRDWRGNYLREFYGQADTDSGVEGWDFRFVGPASSDSSHLWHIHLSFIRMYNNRRSAFNAVLSILSGETFDAYVKRITAPVPAPVTPVPMVLAKSVLVQEVGDPAVYLTDGVKRIHVPNVETLRVTQLSMDSRGLFPKVVKIPAGDLAKGIFGPKA